MSRDAVAGDIPRIVEMGRAYHARMGEGRFVAEDFAAFIEGAIEAPHIKVLISDTGFFVGVVDSLPWDAGEKLAHELFWWGDSALLGVFEQWAEGCSAVRASHPSHKPGVGRLFQRRGYTPCEVIYRKDLPCA